MGIISVYAQQITVNGVVRDAADNSPIPGVSVVVKSTTKGTITNYDGEFQLSVNKGDVLLFSFIGYATQELEAAANMQVVLASDAQELDDVVVIGYGVAKKSDMTGSVTAIKTDEMTKGVSNNAQDLMVGKIAGVDVITNSGQPGAGAKIRVRGGSSLNASNNPLYVIDGLAIDGNNTAKGMTDVLATINPADIESFTVLKDASATAIYGSRASGGVIIITTKKGREGSAPKITYNGDVTVSTIAKKYDALSGDEYRALVSSIEGLDASKLGDANTDWQSEIFRTAVSNNQNISVSGGLASMPYRVSVGYNTANGILKTSWMKRFNVGVNVSPSFLDKHLQLNVNAKYMNERNRYADTGAIGAALSADPTRPVYDHSEEGERFFGGYYQPAMAANFKDKTWTLTNNPNATQNPLALLEMKETLATANDFNGNIEVDYKIHGLEDLHVHANLGAQYTESEQTDDISEQSYSNNYYGWDGFEKYYKYSITGNAYIQYMHDWDNMSINVMGGAEESHFHRNGYNYGQGTDQFTGDAYNVTLREQKEWATHNSLVSYFGRVNYTLLNRYMLTATFRADGSSRFADGNKWGYFPSAAFAWRVNEEPFLESAEWLDDLKLRLGWGQTGQQEGISDFGYTSVYTNSNSYAQYPFGNNNYTTQRPSAYNKDLTWETTTTYNAGIDFTILNGRLTFNADGYLRETTDLLNTVVIPVGTNFGSTLTKNMGELKNYGLEFAVNAKPVVTDDFTWDLSYNISFNHNEITSLVGGEGDDDYYVTTGDKIGRGNDTKVQAHTVGEAASSFWVYQQVYDKAGKPIEGLFVDRNADGQINDQDRYFYKKPSADVIMGLTTKFLYKNFDLSASFHASLGNYVYYDNLSNRGSISASGLYSNSSFSNTYKEAVEVGFTGVGTEYYLSDYYVKNASYIKCSTITLGYSFPSLLEVAGRKVLNGRVFFNVQNPFIITKYEGLDPEVSSGIDSNPYPRPRSFQLGLNLNF